MIKKPAIPEPLAAIPQLKLWTILTVPPAVTVVGTLVANDSASAYGGTLLTVPVVVFFLIVSLIPIFNRSASVRYRGRSLTILNWSYGLGEMIGCLVLWLGVCVVIALGSE